MDKIIFKILSSIFILNLVNSVCFNFGTVFNYSSSFEILSYYSLSNFILIYRSSLSSFSLFSSSSYFYLKNYSYFSVFYWKSLGVFLKIRSIMMPSLSKICSSSSFRYFLIFLIFNSPKVLICKYALI